MARCAATLQTSAVQPSHPGGLSTGTSRNLEDGIRVGGHCDLKVCSHVSPAMNDKSQDKSLHRRDFLALGSGCAATALLPVGNAAASEVPRRPQPGAPSADQFKLPAGGKMPTRRLGKTGVEVSMVGLGGFHLGLHDEATAVRIVRTAVDHGLTFMDNCWDYNEGKSQLWMGRALKDGYRQRVFLMTKIDGRTHAAAAAQIDQSLEALGTDVIDLLQVHEVIRTSDPGRVFAAGGTMEALSAARKAGKIRFIGFTGHKSPEIHLAMLQAADDHGFAFDTVQMPLNVMDAHYDSFERRVLPVLVDKGIGVLGMKALGSGIILRSAPLTEGALTPVDCLRYALGLPTSVVITGCDTLGILMQAIDTAYRWKPLSAGERAALLARTAAAATRGEWEKYKTSQLFDGTAQNPHWLETASLKG
jgi:predicted aldo/keto reductase-like oxidoreductase